MMVAPTVMRVLLDYANSTTPELRQARARGRRLAIDADAINKAVYDGKGGKQTGHFDRHSFGYNKDLKAHPYDPAKAKQLLAEAGFPNGMPIRPRGQGQLPGRRGLAGGRRLPEQGWLQGRLSADRLRAVLGRCA